MTDDPTLLAAVLANPADDAPRLVYADWLDEHGQPDRAAFLRLDCQLSRHPLADPRTPAVATRVRALALTLDPDWVAVVRRVRLPDAIEATLDRLQFMLSGGNYAVSLGLWRVPARPASSPAAYVAAALGPAAVVGEVRPAPSPDAVADVERCLRYYGDRGHGPDTAALASVDCDRLIRRVRGYLERSARDGDSILQFGLGGGHPFCPVWWDFAYLWVKPWVAVVFLGSSSD
jgi:uncharacterized protein (TIGR02996 family)